MTRMGKAPTTVPLESLVWVVNGTWTVQEFGLRMQLRGYRRLQRRPDVYSKDQCFAPTAAASETLQDFEYCVRSRWMCKAGVCDCGLAGLQF